MQVYGSSCGSTQPASALDTGLRLLYVSSYRLQTSHCHPQVNGPAITLHMNPGNSLTRTLSLVLPLHHKPAKTETLTTWVQID